MFHQLTYSYGAIQFFGQPSESLHLFNELTFLHDAPDTIQYLLRRCGIVQPSSTSGLLQYCCIVLLLAVTLSGNERRGMPNESASIMVLCPSGAITTSEAFRYENWSSANWRIVTLGGRSVNFTGSTLGTGSREK